MGIYSICLGKGIMIPVKMFVLKYLDEINETYEDGDDEYVILEKLVKKHIGEEYQISSVGHDAFQNRSGMECVLGDSLNSKVYPQIKEWREKSKENNVEVPFEQLGCSDLIFIGRFKELDAHNGEFGYYIKTPELLYGLTALIPQIVEYSLKLSNIDVSILNEKLDQIPCVWTFSMDCHCCG